MTQKAHDDMKYKLAESMKQCMKTSPLEKITVGEIVELCGTTRQTFYRHFKDKYDLVNWYFDKILLESFEHMGEGRTIYEGLVNKFCYIEKEKIFFKTAFSNDAQNNLKEHDFQLILTFYTERIEENTGRLVTQRIKFLLEMYCQGSIYMTVQWVMGRVKCTPEEMARWLIDAMPAELAQIFYNLELLKEGYTY